MKRKCLTIVALLATLATTAQSQLSITNDPVAFSMGNTGVVSEASAYSIYNNSAATAFSENKGAFGVSYLGWSPDGVNAKIPSIAGYYKVGQRMSVLIGAQYSIFNKQTIINDKNEPDGTFRPHNYSVNFGVAYRFLECLSGAVNLRYINAKIFDTNASAVGADIQLMYQKNKFSAALAFNNLGSEFDFDLSKVKQPMQVNAGASYKILGEESIHGLEAAAKVGYVFAPSDEKSVIAGIGLEYSFAGIVSARAGYSYSDKDKYMPSFATVGLGFNLANIHLNGGYLIGTTKNSPIKNSFVIGLSYTLF